MLMPQPLDFTQLVAELVLIERLIGKGSDGGSPGGHPLISRFSPSKD
jgi:hypothetical protein